MATKVATQIVDCDSHFLPYVDFETLRDNLPSGLSPQVRDMYARDGIRYLDPGSFRRAGSGAPGGRPAAPSALRDADARVKVLDEELHVDVQLLIPHPPYGSLFGGQPDGEDKPLPVRIAMARAYNNAAAAVQNKYPSRFIGTAVVPFDDLGESQAEVRRAVRELGLQAVVIPGNWLGKNYDSIELYPFWETISDLNIPLFVHQIPQSCAGSVVDHVARYPMVGHERMHRLHIGTYLGFGLEYALDCAALTLGGVLDEFPKLRFCFFEAGAGWVPYAMLGCDRSFYIEPACSRTKTLPSELIKKHCFTAVEFMEHIPALVQSIGNENFFFGTDYPHAEYRELPNMVSKITDREGLTDEDKENILGRNMLRALGKL